MVNAVAGAERVALPGRAAAAGFVEAAGGRLGLIISDRAGSGGRVVGHVVTNLTLANTTPLQRVAVLRHALGTALLGPDGLEKRLAIYRGMLPFQAEVILDSRGAAEE